jgi:DNA methylase
VENTTDARVALMRRPILNQTRRGELVHELFLGSGTTLAAAEVTSHVCYGIELDPEPQAGHTRTPSLASGKLGVLFLSLHEHRDVWVSIFPELEKILEPALAFLASPNSKNALPSCKCASAPIGSLRTIPPCSKIFRNSTAASTPW